MTSFCACTISPCQLPNTVVRMAQVLKIPAGAEAIPEHCPDPQHPAPPMTDRRSLRGMTVRAALDELVRIDPRYRWVETDGVIVMRPTEAWTSRDHFIHRSLPSFAFTDQNVSGALAALRRAVGPGGASGEKLWSSSWLAGRRFSVELRTTSIYEALNATVRAHGELTWILSYCQPEVSLENSSLQLVASDGSGVGWRGVFSRSSNGTAPRPCFETAQE
jgi:hypothetical protein